MPYGEKLKTIKKEKKLTNAEIHKVCNVPLATVTRVFDEGSQGGNFETYVSLARGLGFSLDELAGLKQPDEPPLAAPIIETFNSYSEILKEKDDRIQELKEQNEKLQAAFNELKKSSDKTIDVLEKEKHDIRHEKRKITSALIGLVLVLVVGLLIDLLNGHIGNFRY
jgi:transcriptional regulator with XRE-family HTH domain